MSIFNLLAKAQPTFSSVHLSECDDFFRFEPPKESMFHEVIDMPDGPGVQQLKGVLDLLPEVSLRHGPWICGGAPRRLFQGKSLEEGDIDFFFRDSKSWLEFTKALEDHELIIATKRAKTYNVNGLKVQMINRQHYESLDKVFQDFDFSVCQIATDGKNLACTKQGQRDIQDGLIRFAPQGTVAKHTLVQRMAKYVGHGFVPEPGLFELIVKSGMDYVSAWSIFEGAEVAIYNETDGASEEEEVLSVSEIDEATMRECAKRLGLERK